MIPGSHRVTFQNPGAAVPDGDGGYTHVWADITPPDGWFVSIAPASPQDLERLAAGTVITQSVSLVKGRFHPNVTTATRMVLRNGGQSFAIAGTRNVDYRSIDMELLAIETNG